VRLTPEVERTVRRYVLGDLEEDFRPELEELLITDSDAFDALGVIEDELIEEYLDETGSKAERQSFERHFLSSREGMRRLRLARALRDRSSGARARPLEPVRPAAWLGLPRGSRAAVLGLAAVLAVALLGSVSFFSLSVGHAPTTAQSSSPRPGPVPPTPIVEIGAERADTVARLEAEHAARSKAEARLAQLEQQVRSSTPRIATFALAAGLLRGEGSLPRVSVPAGAVLVGLRLELAGDDYPRYRAALVDANGDEIWAASKLRAEGKPGPAAVVLWLPTASLPRGDYQVKLSGVSEGAQPEAVGTYSFRVIVP
jgi:hypothetical protein